MRRSAKEVVKRDAKRQTGNRLKPSKRRPRHAKNLDDLAKEQEHKHVDVDDLLGMGKDLWKSDEEFLEFLAGINELRRKGRSA